MKLYASFLSILLFLINAVSGHAEEPLTVYLVPSDNSVEDLLNPVLKGIESNLGVKIMVTPSYQFLSANIYNKQRGQYDASAILDELYDNFQNYVIKKKSIIIAVTDKDLYSSGFDWNYVFGLYWDSKVKQSAVLSTARFEQSFYGEEDDAKVEEDRLSKMLTRYICIQLFHTPLNSNPQSVLRDSILSTYDLDEIIKDCDGKIHWQSGPFVKDEVEN